MEWMDFIWQSEVRPHAVFLSDYDMLLTEHLAQGVDVWINTPRRPWEASGTSGMKVLVNGGLNLWMAGGRRPTPLKSAGPWGTAGSMTRTRAGTLPRPTRSTACSNGK